MNEAQLGFTVPGRVQEVNVALGDDVEPGEVLVTLETADQEALVAQAEAAVQTAQANLDLLLADTPPGEIAVAETAISAARALVSQAEAAQEGAEAQCAVAQSGIAAAEAALKVAQAQTGQLDTGPQRGTDRGGRGGSQAGRSAAPAGPGGLRPGERRGRHPDAPRGVGPGAGDPRPPGGQGPVRGPVRGRDRRPAAGGGCPGGGGAGADHPGPGSGPVGLCPGEPGSRRPWKRPRPSRPRQNNNSLSCKQDPRWNRSPRPGPRWPRPKPPCRWFA